MELTENNQWQYQGSAFTSEVAQQCIDHGYIGFIYEVTDNLTKRKYIGKKLLISKRRLPPLKGQTRKRIKMVESDWKTYFGSSELVQSLVAERLSDFSREVLFLGKTKGELNYREAEMQFSKGVLISDDYFNGIINCKIHKSHVKHLKSFYADS
jgi:hypothetical protein